MIKLAFVLVLSLLVRQSTAADCSSTQTRDGKIICLYCADGGAATQNFGSGTCFCKDDTDCLVTVRDVCVIGPGLSEEVFRGI